MIMQKLRELFSYQSAMILVLANLIILFEALFFGWSTIDTVLLYWSEGVIIGFYTLLKMQYAKGEIQLFSKPPTMPFLCWLQESTTTPGFRFFLSLFFLFQYIVFVSFLLFFILLFFSASVPKLTVSQTIQSFFSTIASGTVLLFISHGFSFVTNYLGKKEYERVSSTDLMFSTYYRVLPVEGAVFVMLLLIFGMPIVLLILGKIALDLNAHVHERNKFT